MYMYEQDISLLLLNFFGFLEQKKNRAQKQGLHNIKFFKNFSRKNEKFSSKKGKINYPKNDLLHQKIKFVKSQIYKKPKKFKHSQSQVLSGFNPHIHKLIHKKSCFVGTFFLKKQRKIFKISVGYIIFYLTFL